MIRILYFTLLCCFIQVNLKAQNVFIPDTSFKAYLVNNPAVNTNSDNEIQVSEAQAFSQTLSCFNLGIYDLTGLEEFTNVVGVEFNNNNISLLDISNNTNLTSVLINNNDLDSVDLSVNTGLVQFRADYNDISYVKFGNNASLQTLYLGNNELDSIDLSTCPALEILNMSGNNLTELNLDQNVLLNFLRFTNNDISQIDFSNNPLLEDISCYQNVLIQLDLSNLPLLEKIWCHQNEITSIDFSNNPLLEDVFLFDNPIHSVDLSSCPNLFRLEANNTPMYFLNVANGNNGIITNFKAQNSPNLSCIKVDASIDPLNPPAGWTKDATAAYNTVCYTCPGTAPSPTQISVTACDSFVSPSGQVTFQSGTLLDSLYNNLGCDSIIEFSVNINTSYLTYDEIISCTPSYTLADGNTVNSSGIYDVILPSVAGCDSLIVVDLTIASITSNTLNLTVCNEYISSNGTVFNSSGTYMDTLTNAAGCDSILTLNLTIEQVNITIDTTENDIYVIADNANFQWIDCSDNSLILGATDSVFTASSTGSYAVEVSNGSCVYQSPCYTIMVDPVSGIRDVGFSTSIYPNPLKQGQSIRLSSSELIATISVYDLLGSKVQELEKVNSLEVSMPFTQQSGTYFLRIVALNGKTTVKKILVE